MESTIKFHNDNLILERTRLDPIIKVGEKWKVTGLNAVNTELLKYGDRMQNSFGVLAVTSFE